MFKIEKDCDYYSSYVAGEKLKGDKMQFRLELWMNNVMIADKK